MPSGVRASRHNPRRAGMLRTRIFLTAMARRLLMVVLQGTGTTWRTYMQRKWECFNSDRRGG